MPLPEKSGNPVALRRFAGLLRFWSKLETSLLAKKLPTNIEQPIFVCGLARAGTTIVTHRLNEHPQTASFLYRDLPFAETPYFWNLVNNAYYGRQDAAERPHGDAITIDPDSPDAFEELLWKDHLENYDDHGFCQVLDEHYRNPKLEDALRTAMRKILYVRGNKTRYLSKGNYNLFRLQYITSLFPDAKIVLCTRNAEDHAASMARVHHKFLQQSQADPAFGKQLAQLGHYEFGPHRKAIRLNETNYRKTLDYWQKGKDYEGYLLQWHDVYSFARDTYADHPNVYWLDNKDMVEEPEKTMENIRGFCGLM